MTFVVCFDINEFMKNLCELFVYVIHGAFRILMQYMSSRCASLYTLSFWLRFIWKKTNSPKALSGAVSILSKLFHCEDKYNVQHNLKPLDKLIADDKLWINDVTSLLLLLPRTCLIRSVASKSHYTYLNALAINVKSYDNHSCHECDRAN